MCAFFVNIAHSGSTQSNIIPTIPTTIMPTSTTTPTTIMPALTTTPTTANICTRIKLLYSVSGF